MINRKWVIAAALAGAPVAAVAAQGSAKAPSPAPTGEISKEQAEKLLAQCGAKRFETTAEFEFEGKKRRTGLRVCAQPGDTEAKWIERLEKTVAEVEAQPKLPEGAKAKLVGDLRGEIARLRLKKPSLPAADALVATVPPMPVPKPRPVAPPLPVGAAPVSALLSAPPLTIRCSESGDVADAIPCDEFRRNTVITVRADGDFTAPATLRFVRKGEPRADVPLGTMRRGQLVRLSLPVEVCARVVRSNLTIEVVPGNAANRLAMPADTVGPYLLRC